MEGRGGRGRDERKDSRDGETMVGNGEKKTLRNAGRYIREETRPSKLVVQFQLIGSHS